jgi:hypothetical protein
MSRKHRDKGRIEGPFIAVLKQTWQCPAWRTMSPSARLLYIALKARYSFTLRNNGRIYLSVRQAAKEINLNKDTITQAFRELQHYGFIIMTSGSCLGVDGKGKAPHWRLTELGYMHDPPTREFNRWNGTPFRYLEKQNPVRKFQTGCPKNPDITLSEKPGHLGGQLSEKSGHTNGGACPENSDISRLTISPSKKGGDAAEPVAATLLRLVRRKGN